VYLGRLIEECWSENPASRPYFKEIIHRLTNIQADIASKRHWKVMFVSFSLWQQKHHCCTSFGRKKCPA
jgi:hypothetical protein